MGLKTSTIVLQTLAQDVGRKGLTVQAAEIAEQVALIGKTVERTLKRSRAGLAAATGYHRIAAAPIAGKIIAAMAKTPRGEALTFAATLADDCIFPGDETDLYDIVGNLVDNAMTWARATVRITMRAVGRRVRPHHRG